MKPSVIVWDLETVPDLAGFAAANDLVGKSAGLPPLSVPGTSWRTCRVIKSPQQALFENRFGPIIGHLVSWIVAGPSAGCTPFAAGGHLWHLLAALELG
jgi:hypothetical protein